MTFGTLTTPNTIAPVQEWNILIVDDEPDNVDVASATLKFYGAKTKAATNGSIALELLETTSFTCVLLDLSMPILDGWHVIKAIRDNPKLAGLPVIALTAHAMVNDKIRAKREGFDGFISKPYNIMTLADQIKSVLVRLAVDGRSTELSEVESNGDSDPDLNSVLTTFRLARPA